MSLLKTDYIAIMDVFPTALGTTPEPFCYYRIAAIQYPGLYVLFHQQTPLYAHRSFGWAYRFAARWERAHLSLLMMVSPGQEKPPPSTGPRGRSVPMRPRLLK